MSTTSSRGISAPIIAQKRGTRNSRSIGSVFSSHTSTMPGHTVPPDTSAMSAAAMSALRATGLSSTPRS